MSRGRKARSCIDCWNLTRRAIIEHEVFCPIYRVKFIPIGFNENGAIVALDIGAVAVQCLDYDDYEPNIKREVYYD